MIVKTGFQVAAVLALSGAMVSADESTSPALVQPLSFSTQGSAYNQMLPFNGYYAGATLGYAFEGSDRVGIRDGVNPLLNVGTLVNEGLFAGIELGHQWRSESRVYGLSIGLDVGDVSSNKSGAGYTAKMDLEAALTTKVSMGHVVSDKTLIYGFSGLSFGSFEYKINGNGASGPVALDANLYKAGYVVGLGVEHMMSKDVSLRTEYQYSNYGKTTLWDGLGNSTEATPDYHSVRVGVNYRF